MAVTNEKSTQTTNTDASPPVANGTDSSHGVLRIAFFTFTQGAAAGDATSTIKLVDLPAGRVRLLLDKSFVECDDQAASCTIDIGWDAYTDQNGAAVAADQNGLDDGRVIATGPIRYNLVKADATENTIAGASSKLFDSQTGVRLSAQINDAVIAAASTVNGEFVYVLD